MQPNEEQALQEPQILQTQHSAYFSSEEVAAITGEANRIFAHREATDLYAFRLVLDSAIVIAQENQNLPPGASQGYREPRYVISEYPYFFLPFAASFSVWG